MSKPLELTVHPPLPPMPIGKWEIQGRLNWWRDRECEIDASESKRLTDAEIAADYYREAWCHSESIADHDGYDGMRETRQHRYRATVLWRFATLPHYDEVEA